MVGLDVHVFVVGGEGQGQSVLAGGELHGDGVAPAEVGPVIAAALRHHYEPFLLSVDGQRADGVKHQFREETV